LDRIDGRVGSVVVANLVEDFLGVFDGVALTPAYTAVLARVVEAVL